jgi:hypothetical protein
MRLPIIICLALSGLCLAAARAGEPLFDFDDGVAFYTFANPETTLTVEQADESALRDSRSMRLTYSVAGDPAYLGVGVDFEHFAAAAAQWKTVDAAAGMRLIARAEKPTALSIQLRTAEGTFTAKVTVDAEWARYAVPFSSFRDKDGKAFDPETSAVVKMELRPARKPDQNSVWIDQIELHADIAEAKRDGIRGAAR